VRLAALLEAPYAFGSTYEAELGASEQSWRHRLVDRTRFVAEVDGRVAGTVGVGPGEVSGAAALTALWVNPIFRGKGVGSALIDTVVDWAIDRHCSQVLLWVTDVNQTAENLYKRHGFARTGRFNEMRTGQAGFEYEMSKPL
jgi:GNAT superfamily N-acetyltransferase